MSDLIRAAAERDADALALDDGNGLRLTYAELDRRVAAAATLLAEAGVGVGDVLVLLTGVGPDQVVWLHGAWRLGLVVVPLHPHATVVEVAGAVATVGPALAIVDADTRSRLGAFPDLALLDAAALSDEPAEGPSGRPAPAAPGPAQYSPAGRAAIVWTSGTAGRPRGVALTWEALLFHAEASRQRLDLAPSDRWYASLSLAHVGGLALVSRAAAIGSAVVLPGPFSSTDFMRLAEGGRITHASLVPVMLQRILESRGDARAPDALRALLIGGGAAPPALVERAHALGYPVAPTYGLSEASSQVATATPGQSQARPDIVGAPLDGVEIRTASDGEILVRGPTLAQCYVGSDTPLLDDEGWLHTGDIGALTANGMLQVRGRRADRIVTGGFNVDPAEVEAALLSLAQVSDACVVGVADETWGERLVALLVASGTVSMTHDDLKSALSAQLRAEKLPKAFRWVDTLPRNRSGKLDRASARSLAEELEP